MPGRPAEPSLAARDPNAPIPLTFAQEVLWLLDRSTHGLTAYNVPAAWRVRGALDVPALERALASLVARHETLRTLFESREGGAVQVVLPVPVVFTVATHDLSALSPDVREKAASEVIRNLTGTPFDLHRQPGFRVALVRLAADDHVLLLLLHHIVTDYASRGIVREELGALYDAAVRGVASALPPLALQYGDFAVWQRQVIQGEGLEERLAYWREALAGMSPLNLPTDHAPVATAGFAGATTRAVLPDEFAQRIRSFAGGQSTTPFMVFLAALQAVLCRTTGQDDIVVGSPVAGRVRGKTDRMVGYFAQALPMRTRLDGDPACSELLTRVRRTVLQAVRHQDVPMELLVQDLQRRQSWQGPLLRVAFTMHGPLPDLRLGEARVSFVEIEQAESKFDLAFQLTDDDKHITFELAYRTELFRPETGERLLARVMAVVEQMIANPSRRVSELDLLTASERAAFEAWNDTSRPYDRAATLDSLIAEQVARTPDAVAVVDDKTTLTYAELARRAAAVATRLREAGVAPGSRVAVFSQRRADLVAVLLGILQTGAAYVPIDPEYPADRISMMLGDSAVAAVIADESVADSLPAMQAPRILFNDAVATAIQPAAPHTDADAPAYVIHTSGSTGRPKGVVISHRSIVNHMTWMNTEFPLGADDVVLQKTPITFDASVWEFWAPLMAGARLRFAAPGGDRDSHYLANMLAGGEISVVQFVPALLDAVLDEPGFVPARRLTRVFCGGERLTHALATRLRKVSSATLVNLYGPTEATIDATSWTNRSTDPIPDVIPIGRPIANARLYVLDQQQRLATMGSPGELYIGGDGVALGYLFKDGLTAERFLPDPFRPGRRMYRTGDLVRYLPSGDVEYLGRADDQLKIRGVRIEPGEVEEALRTSPDVRECAVVGRAMGAADGTQLVAFYVTRHPGDLTEEARAQSLRAWLRTRLPDHMVPAAFVRLDELPRQPNGKIDRRALQERKMPGAGGPGAFTAPRSGVERELSQIWEQLLKVSPIGVESNFFDLGGHSLLAMRMLARIGEKWGLRLPLRAVFDAPTVGQLAQRIIARQAGATIATDGTDAVVVPPVAVEPVKMEAWNDTDRVLGDPTTMTGLINASAIRRSSEIAVASGGHSLTWSELSERANLLAHRLQALGVGPDVPVGLCLDRSVELIVGMYGILAAGGAYVPLPPDQPPARLAQQCAESGTTLVVTSTAHRAVLPDGVRTVALDTGGGGARRVAGGAAGVRGRSGAPGVRVVHVGVDGRAQGRRGDSRKPRELHARDCTRPRTRSRGRGAAVALRVGLDARCGPRAHERLPGTGVGGHAARAVERRGDRRDAVPVISHGASD